AEVPVLHEPVAPAREGRRLRDRVGLFRRRGGASAARERTEQRQRTSPVDAAHVPPAPLAASATIQRRSRTVKQPQKNPSAQAVCINAAAGPASKAQGL